jgi:hypothetical protein
MDLGKEPPSTHQPTSKEQDQAGMVIAPTTAQGTADLARQMLSPDEHEALAAMVVKNLDTPERQKAAAKSVLGTLTPPQQAEVAESLLGSPDPNTRQRLWYMVVGTMALAVFVFGSMAFTLIYQTKAAEAPLALATTALGGLVGLLATSPGARRSE